MAEIVKITDHESRALKRRMEQWKEKPNFEKLIKIFVGGYPDMEDVFFDLINKTFDINAAEGEQLDNLGRIVDQPRLGFDDDFYRILISIRIGINISEGEPERIISIAKILTGADFVHYMNLFNGEVAIGVDGTIDAVTKDFLLRNMQRVLMGGVRLNYISTFQKDGPLAFAGVNASFVKGGFGTTSDPLIGGGFAKINIFKKPFAFAGNSTANGGFGTTADPLVGGVFV